MALLTRTSGCRRAGLPGKSYGTRRRSACRSTQIARGGLASTRTYAGERNPVPWRVELLRVAEVLVLHFAFGSLLSSCHIAVSGAVTSGIPSKFPNFFNFLVPVP